MRDPTDGAKHRFQGHDGTRTREPDDVFDPHDVWCPECEEPAGRKCRTLGAETRRNIPHAMRADAARHAERVGRDPAEAECPHCGEGPKRPCRTVGGNRTAHHTRRGT